LPGIEIAQESAQPVFIYQLLLIKFNRLSANHLHHSIQIQEMKKPVVIGRSGVAVWVASNLVVNPPLI
jgi:hypothetical protein